MAERPSFTLTEAAERCGVSISTMKRRQAQGDFPNAWKDSRRRWRVPVPDLLAAGLSLSQPVTQEAPEPEAPASDDAELVELREQLKRERQNRQKAEEQAALYRDRVADLKHSLDVVERTVRLLEAPKPEEPAQPQPPQPQEPTPPPVADAAKPQRRSWWSRLTGG